MDKNSIKKYAVWARRELISRVSQKALQYGVSENEIIDVNADTINGHLLTSNEKKQRQALINRIKQIGYQQTMEEAAYTWFNRFSALRYMEVNGFLPTHVRVFTDEQNAFKPQILAEAIHLELDGLNMEKVYELKDQNKTDELYKYLLITQCNALSTILPGMFTRIADYTELLFPDNLLREGSVIEQMISMIPEDDWKDAVQIIGWLYQYYNAEPKDKVFENLKKNIKISKENIPAATQLFTPDWIVRYMVENSLGRLWVEGHPNDELKANWKYYLEEAEQEPEVQAQLVEIRKEYAALKPEEIKVIDPCMGSGHILVYMFDVLVQIYESYGYNAREAAGLILQNNLYGLDIDDRAAQLAYFAVMMKARQYDRRLLTRGIQPNIYSIRESHGIQAMTIEYFHKDDPKLKADIDRIVTEMRDAKEYGSILNITPVDFAGLYARFDEIRSDISMMKQAALDELLPLVQCAEALAQKYDVVVTNPPYMGANNMSPPLNSYIKNVYPESKIDLYSCCITRCVEFAKQGRMIAMITMESWMFLSKFSKFRNKLLQNICIQNLVHMPYDGQGKTSLGISFGTSAFSFLKTAANYNGQYMCIRYYENDENGDPIEFPTKNERYVTAHMSNYTVTEDRTISYWLSEQMMTLFRRKETVGTYCEPRQGLATSDNERFLRLWYEVLREKESFSTPSKEAAQESHFKWFALTKGGEYRKWYGNNYYVVDWENDGAEMKASVMRKYPYLNSPDFVVKNQQYYFRPGVTWSTLTSGKISFRNCASGFIMETKGSICYPLSDTMQNYLLGYLNSVVCEKFAMVVSPTIDLHEGPVGRIPMILSSEKKNDIEYLVQENIDNCKLDWDGSEISWDFKRNPLV